MWGFWENFSLIITLCAALVAILTAVVNFANKNTMAITRLDATIEELKCTLDGIKSQSSHDLEEIKTGLDKLGQKTIQQDLRIALLEAKEKSRTKAEKIAESRGANELETAR